MALEDLRAKLDALRKSRAGEPPTTETPTGSDVEGAGGADSPSAQEIIEEEDGAGAASPDMGVPPDIGATPPEAATAAPPTPSYLTQDNFNQDFGQWFGNDSSLGEELFRQMNVMGVDTKAATEAALRNVLEDVVNRSRAVMQQLSYFISNVMQQTNQMAQMSAAVNNALAMKGEPIPQVGVGNPPPEEPAGADAGAGAGGGMPPADMGGGEPPSDAGGGEEPSPSDAGGGEPPQQEGTPSDARIKNVSTGKYVVSDAQAKNIFRQLKSYSDNGNRKQRENILSAVRTGFN